RNFSQEEEQPGASPVAILGYRFWQRRFGRDTNILGKTIVLNGHAVTIVGVADPKFQEADASAVFMPLGLQPLILGQGDWLQDSDMSWLMVRARLRPGVSVAQAQAEADVLGSSFNKNSHRGIVLTSATGVSREMQRQIGAAT